MTDQTGVFMGIKSFVLEGDRDYINDKLDYYQENYDVAQITQSHVHPTLDKTNNKLVMHWCVIIACYNE